MPKTAEKIIAPEDMKILVIGPNCWGCGDTLDEALLKAKKALGCRPKMYVAYVIHPDTTVSTFDGSLEYPKGYRPKKFHEVGMKKTDKK